MSELKRFLDCIEPKDNLYRYNKSYKLDLFITMLSLVDKGGKVSEKELLQNNNPQPPLGILSYKNGAI